MCRAPFSGRPCTAASKSYIAFAFMLLMLTIQLNIALVVAISVVIAASINPDIFSPINLYIPLPLGCYEAFISSLYIKNIYFSS